MPRQAERNSFANDRDTTADFPDAESKLERDPGGKLPPVKDLPPLSAPSAAPRDNKLEERSGDLKRIEFEKTGAVRSSDKPRAAGGRPPKNLALDVAAAPDTIESARSSTITRLVARVPGPLYELALPLVKGIGRPSWGQVVSWTCADYENEVVATIVKNLHTEARRPRGQGVSGTAGHQVTARTYATELAPIEKVLDQAQDTVVDQKITPTMVILAALEVATEKESPVT